MGSTIIANPHEWDLLGGSLGTLTVSGLVGNVSLLRRTSSTHVAIPGLGFRV